MTTETISEFMQAFATQDTEAMRAVCTQSLRSEMYSGETLSSLDSLIQTLSHVFNECSVSRTVISTVTQADTTGTVSIARTSNSVTTANGDTKSFSDFTQFHINQEGQIDTIIQGAGMYYNCFDLTSSTDSTQSITSS